LGPGVVKTMNVKSRAGEEQSLPGANQGVPGRTSAIWEKNGRKRGAILIRVKSGVRRSGKKKKELEERRLPLKPKPSCERKKKAGHPIPSKESQPGGCCKEVSSFP